MKQQAFNSVWDAIESDPIKAENLKIRSALMMQIVLKLNEITENQAEAATLLKTTQPRISALKQGKINDFRLDMLVDYALRLGMNVSIKIAA